MFADELALASAGAGASEHIVARAFGGSTRIRAQTLHDSSDNGID